MVLNLQINNPKLENDLKETYGSDAQSIGKAFLEFIQQQKIKQDIGISIEQLDQGKVISMEETIQNIRAKYK